MRLFLKIFSIFILVTSMSLTPYSKGVNSTTADWVRVNFQTRHHTYGVFIIPANYAKIKLYFLLEDESKLFIGGGLCGAIKKITGPGNIKDPDGVFESFVPKGYVGISVCSHTSVMFLLYLAGNDVNNKSRWVLDYEE